MDFITSDQIRAARGYLGWSPEKLGKESGNLSAPTIRRMETDEGLSKAQLNNIMAVKNVFEKHRIEFIPDNGLKFPKKS